MSQFKSLDPFKELASLIFNIPEDEVSVNQLMDAKRYLYSVLGWAISKENLKINDPNGYFEIKARYVPKGSE